MVLAGLRQRQDAGSSASLADGAGDLPGDVPG
jgi:hypothetical protein